MTQLQKPAVPPPTERIGFLLYRAGLLVSQVYEAQMRPLGYSPVEVGILTYLMSGGKSHVRGIARALGVSPQTVVNVTQSLEGRQLVQRMKSASDQRAKTITLTAAGVAELRRIDVVVQAFDEEIARTIGAASVTTMIQGLKSLLDTDLL